MNSTQPRIRKQYGIKELTELLKRIRGEIQAFREHEGISQTEFARRARVSKTTVNDLENGNATDIQLSTLLLLSREMNKSVTELLRESDLTLQNGDRKSFLRGFEDLERVVRDFGKLYRKYK